MDKKKVLVCGASGFIGRNLFERLSNRRDLEVYGTYLHNEALNKIKPDPRLWRVDLTDRYHTHVVTQGFDYIINTAAMTDGSGAIALNPAGYIADNIRINSNLIEAAYINQIQHLVFLSCTVMYPSSNRPLKEEEYDLNKVHPKYFMGARMKVFSEDLCRFYAGLGKTKYTAARHTNIYGPYDKFDLKRGHVLAATIEKVMQAEKEITVWGTGIETRDFLYIDDLINFIEKTIERQKSNFEIFNVGCGKTYSVNELVEKIVSCSGKKVRIVHDLEKSSIETRMNIDIEKAQGLLDWKSEIGLLEGLNKTVEWYISNRSR